MWRSAPDQHNRSATTQPRAFARRPSVARCTLPLGDGTVAISTTSDETEQSFEVAIMQDNGNPACNVVAKGWIVGAASRALLTEAVGIPEAFASK